MTTRPQNGVFEAEKENDEDIDFETAIFVQGELVDVGKSRIFLLPGDLVLLL